MVVPGVAQFGIAIVPVSGTKKYVAPSSAKHAPSLPFEVDPTTLRVFLNVGYGTHRITPSGTWCAR